MQFFNFDINLERLSGRVVSNKHHRSFEQILTLYSTLQRQSLRPQKQWKEGSKLHMADLLEFSLKGCFTV